MRTIYMNEFIREKKTHVPVIVVETTDAGVGRSMPTTRVYTDHVDIMYEGTIIATVRHDPANNPSKTHDVKVWIEVASSASSTPPSSRSTRSATSVATSTRAPSSGGPSKAPRRARYSTTRCASRS